MDDDTQPLMISALQHFANCPRQFALFHVEHSRSENFFSAEAHRLREQMGWREPDQRAGVRLEPGVPVRSERHGLSGRLDLLEIEGDPPRYFPVQYKREKPKIEAWERIQLCALAMCLEETEAVRIDQGALWYWRQDMRQTVKFDDLLRTQTLQLIDTARSVLEKVNVPPPINDNIRCRACGFLKKCNPALLIREDSGLYLGEPVQHRKPN